MRLTYRTNLGAKVSISHLRFFSLIVIHRIRNPQLFIYRFNLTLEILFTDR